MTPFRSPLLAAAVTVAPALAACRDAPVDTQGTADGGPDLEHLLTAHAWLLDVTDAAGTAPCNSYRGAVTLDGDDGVRIDDIATTLMHCEPAVVAAESACLEALAQVRTAAATVDVTPTALFLLDGAGCIVLTAYRDREGPTERTRRTTRTEC